MFKMRCGIQNAYIIDITMYKMYVSLCSYCTIRILISKILTGTYDGSYSMYLRCVFIELWIFLYILLPITSIYTYVSQIHMCNLLHMYRLKS